MKIKWLEQSKIKPGERVFVRTDLNVPLSAGRITDDYKINAALPTLRWLLQARARLIIATHLGRPEKPDQKFSTAPLAKKLAEQLKIPVSHCRQAIGLSAATAVARLPAGEALLLENLRFYPEEQANDLSFARALAELADHYVNDGFAVSHRRHASVCAVKLYLRAYGGFLLKQEIDNLGRILKPVRPLVAILGGAKIETKIPLLKKMSVLADHILLGGRLANIFLAARGYGLRAWRSDQKEINLARRIYTERMLLPMDLVVSAAATGQGPALVKKAGDLDKGDYAFDLGPKTVDFFSHYIAKARTLFWNGPMGWYEKPAFSSGTVKIARLIAARARGRAFGVGGGGETVEVLRRARVSRSFDWVSTGGGASLSYLSGASMPGLDGLDGKKSLWL